MPINGRAYKRQFTVWEVMEGGEGGGGGGRHPLPRPQKIKIIPV